MGLGSASWGLDFVRLRTSYESGCNTMMVKVIELGRLNVGEPVIGAEVDTVDDALRVRVADNGTVNLHRASKHSFHHSQYVSIFPVPNASSPGPAGEYTAL